MSRPGFVLEVDDRTPPLVVHEGEGFRLEEFPLGTHVVYPPESMPGVPDVDEAIQRALLHPEGSEPLTELLRAGMRLTIESIDGVRKLSQNRNEGDRMSVLNGFAHSSDPSARQLAAEMSRTKTTTKA